jgi:hypothetical protein
MAQLNQLSAQPVLDVEVHNYTGSTIVAGSVVILDTSNTGGANTAVGVTLPASDATPFGILVDDIPTLKTGRCRVLGVAVGIASATVHVGSYVKCDSAGKVLASTGGTYVTGIAMTEAVNGDYIKVLIDRSKNA